MENTDLAEMNRELKDFTSTASQRIDRLGDGQKEASARLLAIEQKLTSARGSGDGGDGQSIGDQVANSPQVKAMLQNDARRSGRISITGFKTAIVNATGQNQPLVPAYRMPGIVPPGQRRLTVRDLLPNLNTNSNMVEFCKETSSTNNAGMQATEGDPKGESALGFTLSYEPVQTLAHWIPASRQVMDDSASLASYINARLAYMLKLKEEDQLLNGSGSTPNLSGLLTNATAYDTSFTTPATDSYIDVLQHAITQVEENSDFEADGIILNNLDWASIQLIKTSGGGADGRYVYADPHSATGPRLWGLPVVPTKSMARGEFLVGAFAMAAAIWDRNSVTIELSREHDDFFTRNLVAVLVEERLCLTTFRDDALCAGGFPFGS
jgi:HK97 family phage major capsid protein